MKSSSPILLGSTPRPLLGEIVEVPAGVSTPVVYCEQRRQALPTTVGRIVEVLPNLISVAFFGYPTPWDYSMREAAAFTLTPN